MKTLYSLPVDQTNMFVHLVEVQVQHRGLEPEPDLYDVQYDEEDIEEDNVWFIREYCYLVIDHEDPDLYSTIVNFVNEDNTEGWDIDDITITDVQSDHISEYPSNCNMMDRNIDDVWNEEFIRCWCDDTFVKNNRLYVDDITHVLFNDILYYGEEDTMTNDDIINEYKTEGYELQIHTCVNT